MLDIHNHGGSFEGNVLRINGKEIILKTEHDIKKGDFISTELKDTRFAEVPSSQIVQPPFLLPPGEPYSNIRSLVTDKGTVAILSGTPRTTGSTLYYLRGLIKLPDGNYSTHSTADSIRMVGWLFGISKLTSNVFALFHSTRSSDSAGVNITIVRISDSDGRPYLVSTTTLKSSSYFKNFYYIPFDDNSLRGLFLYNTGVYSTGTADSASLYYEVVSFDKDFKNITIEKSSTLIKTTSGEPFGDITNLRYSSDNSVLFSAHRGRFKIDEAGNLTVITSKDDGAKVDLRASFSYGGIKGKATFITSTGDIFEVVYNSISGAGTLTTLYSNPSSSTTYKMAGEAGYSTGDIFERSYYLSDTPLQVNNQYRFTMKPVGSNAFMTFGLIGSSSFPGNYLYTYIYYFDKGLNSVAAVRRQSSAIITTPDYLEYNFWCKIGEVSEPVVFLLPSIRTSNSARSTNSLAVSVNYLLPEPEAKITRSYGVEGIAISNTKSNKVKVVIPHALDINIT